MSCIPACVKSDRFWSLSKGVTSLDQPTLMAVGTILHGPEFPGGVYQPHEDRKVLGTPLAEAFAICFSLG